MNRLGSIYKWHLFSSPPLSLSKTRINSLSRTRRSVMSSNNKLVLYSFPTPNGVAVSILLEELKVHCWIEVSRSMAYWRNPVTGCIRRTGLWVSTRIASDVNALTMESAGLWRWASWTPILVRFTIKSSPLGSSKLVAFIVINSHINLLQRSTQMGVSRQSRTMVSTFSRRQPSSSTSLRSLTKITSSLVIRWRTRKATVRSCNGCSLQ